MFNNIVGFGNKENLVNHRICPSWIADLFNIFVCIQVISPWHNDGYKKNPMFLIKYYVLFLCIPTMHTI